MHPLQRAEISADAVVSIVSTEHLIEMIRLFLERQMPRLPNLILQVHQCAPQPCLFRTHTNPKVAFLIARAVQGICMRGGGSAKVEQFFCFVDQYGRSRFVPNHQFQLDLSEDFYVRRDPKCRIA
jgi:hypothetical protein